MKPTKQRFPLLPEVHRAEGPLTEGALLLEGGASRGIYTAGVCDVLMEQGIHMQCIAGVSSGSLNGLNILSRQVGRYASISLFHCNDKRHTGWKALLTDRGMVGFRFLMKTVNRYFPYDSSALSDPERRFVAVSTDCRTGEAFYAERSNCSDMLRAVSASSSLAGVSRIVRLDGKKLLDGGYSEGIPLKWAKEQGYRKRIVVLTRERSFRKSPVGKTQLRLLRLFFRRYPAFREAILQVSDRYAALREALCAQEEAGEIFVIAPRGPVTIARLERDDQKLYELYLRGRQDGTEALPALRAYLAKP